MEVLRGIKFLWLVERVARDLQTSHREHLRKNQGAIIDYSVKCCDCYFSYSFDARLQWLTQVWDVILFESYQTPHFLLCNGEDLYWSLHRLSWRSSTRLPTFASKCASNSVCLYSRELPSMPHRDTWGQLHCSWSLLSHLLLPYWYCLLLDAHWKEM